MKLLDQVRDVIQKEHYSIRTEQAYVVWIRKYILFHKIRHPKDMGEREVTQFISFLSTAKNVAVSTQNQALNAIVFLYKQVFHIETGEFGHTERSKRTERLPTVMIKTESGQVLASMSGVYQLMAKPLYGCGLRFTECVRFW